MRRETRVGRCCEIVKFPVACNSFPRREFAKLKPISKGRQAEFGRPKVFTPKKIGFPDKNTHGEASGFRTKGWARIPMMGVVESAASMGGKYDKNIAVNRPDWKVAAIGPNLYQSTMMILRESGYYSTGRKINSRGTAEEEGGSMTGNGECETMRIDGCFFARKVGIMPHAFASPFGIFAIPMDANREHEGRMSQRIGTPWNHSAIIIMRDKSGEIVGNLDAYGAYSRKETNRRRSS